MKTIKGLRWWIIVLVCLGTIMNYLARNSLGVLAPTLKEELSMTTQQYGYVVMAFQFGYTLMQPVCGFIVDLIGLRIGFALFAVLWSFAGVLHAGATGWLSLAGFRTFMGLTEAAAIPSGMKAVAEWFPDKEKSVATGWFNVGTSFGAMLAPPLVLFLSMRHGWQSAFVVTGALGFFWAALWFAFYRSPKQHPRLSKEELTKITEGQLRSAGDKPAEKRSIGKIIGARRFWAIALARFFTEPAWQTLSFWIPLYFFKERGMDLKQIAMFAWLPFLAADLGGMAGGYLSPFLMRFGRLPLIWSRVGGVVLGALMMIGPACVGLVASPYTAIALFCVGGFAHQMISVSVNTLSADVFDPQEVGTANGFTGMSGWIGGLAFTAVVGALADTVGYGPLFGLLGAFDVIAAVLLIVLIRGQSQEERAARQMNLSASN